MQEWQKFLWPQALLMMAMPLIAAGIALPTSPLTPRQKAEHVLNRLAFGPRPAEVEALAAGGDQAISQWIQDQLDLKPPLDPLLQEKLGALKSLSMSIPQLQARYPKPQLVAKRMGLDPTDLENPAKRAEILARLNAKEGDVDAPQKLRDLVPAEQRPARMEEELVAAKFMRAVESPRQLEEVLTDFWFNHFNVDLGKGETRWFVTSYERDTIHRHLFGKFRDLLGATAKSPAMLFYLDNWTSVKDGFNPAMARYQRQLRRNPLAPQPPPDKPKNQGLNENYAREIMELHTLGVDGGYTQDDVKAVARCFTGWTLEKPREEARYIFREAAHDDGQKVVLGRKFRTGGGEEEGEKVMDLLCSQPACARFIATKLCRRFVSDEPPRTLVDRVAKRFMDTDGDLRQVYLALFSAPEFWAKETYQAKIKTPFEFEVSAVRALGGRVEFARPLAGNLARLGQPLYHCQPPTGYKDVAAPWVNTGALVTRLQFSMALGAGRMIGVPWQRPDLNQALGGTQSATTDLPKAARLLLQRDLGPATLASLEQEANAEDRRMPDGETRPMDTAKVVGLLLGSPEFQRR